MISNLSCGLDMERVVVGLSRQVKRMDLYGTDLLLLLPLPWGVRLPMFPLVVE